MGILRNKEQRYEPIRIEDLEDEVLIDEYGNYLFDSDFSQSEPEQDEKKDDWPKIELNRRKKKRSRRNYGPVEIVDGLQVRRNMGAQKWRRVENAKLIMAHADMHDICFDGSDLIEETITAFTRLLRDEEKLKMWNEFIEMDEAKQSKVLQKIDQEIMEANSKIYKPGPSKRYADDKQAEPDKHQPSQAEINFRKLDKKIRDCLLKRRRLQYDYMAKAEKNLRSYFQEFPMGVYFENIACRVKRFYVHAIAQFLQLNSQTINDADSNKLVHIENEQPSFVPPDMALGTFVKWKRQSRSLARNSSDMWNRELEGTL